MAEFFECKVVKDYGCVDGLTSTDRLVLLQLLYPSDEVWYPSSNAISYILYTKHNNHAFNSCPLEKDFDENEFGTSLCYVRFDSILYFKCIDTENEIIEYLNKALRKH